MRIGIVTTYSAKKSAGLERATLDLLKSVLEQDKNNQYLIYTKKGSGLVGFLSDYDKARVIEIGFGKLWKDIGLWFAPRADIYVFNGPQVPIFFKPRNYAVIIYDFAYKLINPKPSALLDWLTKLALKRAKIILSISQASKDDAIRLFDIPRNKIEILHLGFTDMSGQTEQPAPNLPDKFFLSVGTIKERKNNFNIVKALAEFHKSHPDISLVIAGKYNSGDEYAQKILYYIQNNQLTGKVILLGHVSDSQLAYLYRRALALVYPTLLEGFGFPILEAFSCNLPVITSNKSSLPEIAGEAALLVDPADPGDIARAMQRLVSDDNLRQQLKDKGGQRAKDFSWSKTAQNFIDIIKSNFAS